MKTRITIILLFVTTTSLFAQNGAFSKQDRLLNIGIGVNSFYDGGIPIGASFEKGITNNISIGVNADYLSNDYQSFKFTAIYFGVRASYHANELLKINNNKIDLYGGPTLGYRNFSWKDTDQNLGDSYGSGLFLGAYIGGKYFLSKKIGLFTELGSIGSTNARIGIAFKFN
ncbi:hypothetical protein EZ428_12425 [Pedobacter frigiditerrae]|uniref:Outer membrane protein beta-barrel domain-containing protein n=1 Tax=Pedobacter frigiditerrae TaxID=2530452 RepID=A0A4R0MSV9_9SPHI|nr:hypothetical protein [Pedobacter frigiditerrae]TCC90088.1 hypothetical protein EZ428_12425 [Pedobacter frigiditerrae]